MVKKKELLRLNSKYDGVYSAKQELDIGNNKTIPAGTRLRLFFASKGKTVKVYAYPADALREEALGDNILYLFNTDFPNEKYSAEYLEKQLEEKITSGTSKRRSKK